MNQGQASIYERSIYVRCQEKERREEGYFIYLHTYGGVKTHVHILKQTPWKPISPVRAFNWQHAARRNPGVRVVWCGGGGGGMGLTLQAWLVERKKWSTLSSLHHPHSITHHHPPHGSNNSQWEKRIYNDCTRFGHRHKKRGRMMFRESQAVQGQRPQIIALLLLLLLLLFS